MNNKIFIDRCETLLRTIGLNNIESVKPEQVTKWLEMPTKSATRQFLSKAVLFDILKRSGKTSNVQYRLSDACNNKLQSKLKENADKIAAVKITVNYFLLKKPKVEVKEITTASGKKLTKVVSSKELEDESISLIETISNPLNQLILLNKQLNDKIKELENGKDSKIKELEAERDLYKEEVENLQKYKEFYHTIRQTKLN